MTERNAHGARSSTVSSIVMTLPCTPRWPYVRVERQFRHWITADGSSGFPAEPGRYHLVAISCPWAHRTWIFRTLKHLEDIVSMSIVAPQRSDQGWVFDLHEPRYRDTLLGRHSLHEIYTLARPDYTGRGAVPVQWDTKRGTIVNNESSKLSGIAPVTGLRAIIPTIDPTPLRSEIDRWNDLIYHTVNNGVYRGGLAATQEAYEEAVTALFATLARLEERLATQRYLVGNSLTEADWRLFPTLVRFDVAYYGAFLCNLRRLVDYPHLWAYTRELYQMPGIAETVDLEIYTQGYDVLAASLPQPARIILQGPVIDFSVPHGRAAL